MSLSNSSNGSHPPLPSNAYSTLISCFELRTGIVSVTAFTVVSVLVFVPLCVFVLYLGLQRWRQDRSSALSHCDVFTYNTASTELLSVLGCVLLCAGSHAGVPVMLRTGVYLFIFNLSVQTSLHVLTCVERYLAVVHPVFYLSLREARWIRVRNVCIGCDWLLSFVWTASAQLGDILISIYFCIMVLNLITVAFCSLSVLYVLIRPGPGEGGGVRQQVDQSKLRAFYTIMAILGVLVLRIGGSLLTTAFAILPQFGRDDRCRLFTAMIWSCQPSGLVLPLLFLNRTGKLWCCKKDSSGRKGG